MLTLTSTSRVSGYLLSFFKIKKKHTLKHPNVGALESVRFSKPSKFEVRRYCWNIHCITIQQKEFSSPVLLAQADVENRLAQRRSVA